MESHGCPGTSICVCACLLVCLSVCLSGAGVAGKPFRRDPCSTDLLVLGKLPRALAFLIILMITNYHY